MYDCREKRRVFLEFWWLTALAFFVFLHLFLIIVFFCSFTRNNVVRLWKFSIVDMRNLGAQVFCNQFCSGSVNHISLRRFQGILLKMALLCGVDVHFNTSFEELVEPSSPDRGWSATLKPTHPDLEQLTFDVLVGASGQACQFPGFERVYSLVW